MKLTAIALILVTTVPALANDPNWNGDPEPEPPTEEPPTEEPEPEPEPELPVVVPPEPAAPIRTGSDRDPLPQSRPLPCCIQAGELVPLWELFATPQGTLRRCEAALKRGNALIYECPNAVSPEALK